MRNLQVKEKVWIISKYKSENADVKMGEQSFNPNY